MKTRSHRWMGVVAFAWAAGMPQSSAGEDRVQNTVERVEDRVALAQDRSNLKDDQKDRLEIERLRDEFMAAKTAANAALLTSLDAQVEKYLSFELGETRAEVSGAKHELRQDRQEIRSDRREVGVNRLKRKSVPVRADDRHDLRDDRRDKRDDRRDLAREEKQAKSLEELRADWVALPDDTSNVKALEGKGEILDTIAAMARAEVTHDVSETREDRRELREDRRETREDRRDH